ncbi:MAG: mechanosensitive ion channel [Thermodesulfobacteriota bacterium]|nr:mechanosensitive ion channel [Thermodesulfobacteriota bacterium]
MSATADKTDENTLLVDTAITNQKASRSEDRNLSDLIPKSTDLSNKLIEMQTQLSSLQDTSKVMERLLELSQKKNRLQEQLHTLLINPQGNVQQLTSLQNMLLAVSHKASVVAADQDRSIAVLDIWIDFWSKEREDITNWEQGLGASSSLPAVQRVLGRLQKTIDQSQEILNTELLPLLALQEKAGNIQVSIHTLYLRMQDLFENTFQQGIYKHAPFLFSAAFVDQFDRKLLQESLDGIQQAFRPDISFLKKEKLKIYAAILLFIVLYASFYSSRSYLTSSSRWKFIHQRPVSVACYISLAFFFIISGKLPPFWLAVIRALTLLSAIRISRAIVTNTLQKKFITRLALLLLTTDLLALINLPMPMVRLYIIAIAVSLIVFSLLQQRKNKKSEQLPVWLVWAQRLGTLALIVILLAEINGQAELAYFVFVASLKTLFAGLFVWILYLIILALLDLTLHYTPLPLLQKNTRPIISMVQPLLFIGALLLLTGTCLVDWRLFPTSTDAIDYISQLGISFGKDRLSLGLLMAALFLIYAAYCFSKVIQSILLQSVLPRKNVDRGVQLSITRLLHYAIMLIGFLMALQALGFSLTNLTILGGALGVGIGFGLQAIINNFASGLILLFERPIKVGDTIQIGEELAEVKALGLRATILQTRDNAEIVVPNSDLITNQVTNWTLKERRIRIKVPVGVAYGSDVEKVLQILLNCAAERPEILDTPKPSALFLAFGASSLDFELRVFIPEFTDRRRVQSELNLDINREFADAGIEIPFPQRDLHLRSVDPKTAEIFSRKGASVNV